MGRFFVTRALVGVDSGEDAHAAGTVDLPPLRCERPSDGLVERR